MTRIGVRELNQHTSKYVAAGRVTPATTSWHELPPPVDAEDGINVADELTSMREQERY